MALVGLALMGAAVAGCGAASVSNAPKELKLSVVAHPTNLEFVTALGASSRYPTSPLAVGDRVLGRDDLLDHRSVVGSDLEVCTVTFGLNVLCTDVVALAGRGDLYTSWTFQWPANSATGPNSFDGVIEGGTARFRHAVGSFHATVLSNRDVRLDASVTQ